MLFWYLPSLRLFIGVLFLLLFPLSFCLFLLFYLSIDLSIYISVCLSSYLSMNLSTYSYIIAMQLVNCIVLHQSCNNALIVLEIMNSTWLCMIILHLDDPSCKLCTWILHDGDIFWEFHRDSHWKANKIPHHICRLIWNTVFHLILTQHLVSRTVWPQ